MAVDMIENGWVSAIQLNYASDKFANLLDRDYEKPQDSVPLNWQIGLDTNPITLSTGVSQTVAPYTGKLSDTAPKPNIFNVTQPYSNPADNPINKKVYTTTKYVNTSNINTPNNNIVQSQKKNNLLLYGGIALGVALLIIIIKK